MKTRYVKNKPRTLLMTMKSSLHPQTFFLLLPFQEGHLHVFLPNHTRDILMKALQDSSEVGTAYMMTQHTKTFTVPQSGFIPLRYCRAVPKARPAEQSRNASRQRAHQLLPPCSRAPGRHGRLRPGQSQPRLPEAAADGRKFQF